MQFIDEAKIYIQSGDGGAGCVSFRREANVPKGGPDGGDGGRGGSVIFRCVPGLNTLIDFRYTQHFKAKKGNHGEGRNRSGAAAKDLHIDVPVGTQIFTDDESLMLVDFDEVGKEMILAKGGEGGKGNTYFKNSKRQAPRISTPGTAGENMWVRLKLKLLSDVGLAGLPNAGKSTLLSVVSRAKPKIADYPFTTLKPQLGVVYVDGKEFVMADIPGLIAGAHEGTGLGIRFLKHIERCRVVIHLIDISSETLLEDYDTIQGELEAYSATLAQKPQLLALNKTDLMDDKEIANRIKKLKKHSNKEVFTLSAATNTNITPLLRKVQATIEEEHQNEDDS